MMKKIKEFVDDWKYVAVLSLLMIFLALGLRLYHLGIIPVFADEAIYVRWAQVMRAEPTLRFLPLSDGKQPLFMWLVIPFLKIISDPLFAGRATSIIAGIGTMVGVFALSYYFFKSKKVALIASLLYAISPFAVFFDRMALVDSLLAMFGIWTFFFAALTAGTLRLDFAMLTGFALGGALLTKSPALFFSILLPSTWIFSNWPKGKTAKAIQLLKLVSLFFVSYLIGYGLYNILRLGPNFHLVGSRNQDYILPISHLWTNPKDPFISLIVKSFEWIKVMGPGTVLFMAVVGIFVNRRKHFKEIVVLAAWFLLPILVQSEFARVYTARYIVFTLPFLFIIAASSFMIESAFYSKIMIFILLIFVYQALIFNRLLLTNPQEAKLPQGERSGYLEEWTSGYGIKEVADYIKEEQSKGPNKIVVGTEGYFGTLPDGLQMYLNADPKITVIGVGLDIREIPISLIESRDAGNETFLVINNSRFKGDPEELGLELISAYPKALRLKGTREFNTKGPQESLLFFKVVDKPSSSLKNKL